MPTCQAQQTWPVPEDHCLVPAALTVSRRSARIRRARDARGRAGDQMPWLGRFSSASRSERCSAASWPRRSGEVTGASDR